MKNLYASAVGKSGKGYLEKIIQRFGTEKFDYLIFVYDDTEFTESIFATCEFIREKGQFGYFWKKYLIPDRVRSYRYIFPWMDDLDVLDLDVDRLITIMERNGLELAQPALSADSLVAHSMTKSSPKFKVGRFTSFVEIMAQVFRMEAWIKFWEIFNEPTEDNPKSWGYDLIAKKACRIKRMGIIDSEQIRHCGSYLGSMESEQRVKVLGAMQDSMLKLIKKHQVSSRVAKDQWFYWPLR